MEANVKTCKKCGETKPLEAYPKTKKTNDGHSGSCKECRNAYVVAWSARNPEKIREIKAKYRAKNPDKGRKDYDIYLARVGKSRYKPKTPEEIRERKNEYNSRWKKEDRKKHPEKYKNSPRKLEWQRMDRLKHPEKYKEYVKICYYRHHQKYIAKAHEWYKANREYVVERQKVYNRNRIASLADRYVLSLIKGKGGKLTDIPQELIEAKRLQLKIRRMANEISNSTTK
jgi:hypothetical protein